jgi:hypothetical protein
MAEPFADDGLSTDVAGFTDTSLPRLARLPLRRWWSADWFQPIARIGLLGDVEWPLEAQDGHRAVDLARLRAGLAPSRTLVATFTAEASGELFLYVNDAIAAVPFGPTIAGYYRDNTGAAVVAVEGVRVPPLPAGAAPPSP